MKFLKSLLLPLTLSVVMGSAVVAKQIEEEKKSSWIKPAVIAFVITGAAVGTDIYLNGFESSYTKVGYDAAATYTLAGVENLKAFGTYLWSCVPSWSTKAAEVTKKAAEKTAEAATDAVKKAAQ